MIKESDKCSDLCNKTSAQERSVIYDSVFCSLRSEVVRCILSPLPFDHRLFEIVNKPWTTVSIGHLLYFGVERARAWIVKSSDNQLESLLSTFWEMGVLYRTDCSVYILITRLRTRHSRLYYETEQCRRCSWQLPDHRTLNWVLCRSSMHAILTSYVIMYKENWYNTYTLTDKQKCLPSFFWH